MEYTYPFTIQNPVGEKITFKGIEKTPAGDKLLLEAFCEPHCGPNMHTHLRQEEALTVISGKMGYQIQGEQPKYAGIGESVLFKRGTAHKFWAEGEQPLHCNGWVYPANSIVFFLTALYTAQNKTETGRPETFDGAYLLTKFATEYDMPEIPSFVKKVILPFTVWVGRLSGKYNHFKNLQL